MLRRQYNKLIRKFDNNEGENGKNNNNVNMEGYKRINKRLVASIFVFFFLVNILSGGGHLDWWDGTEAFLVTESMVLRHSAKLHPDVPLHYKKCLLILLIQSILIRLFRQVTIA